MFPPTTEMVFDRLCQCIRLGFVTARQPEKMRLQVEIKDSPGGSLVTKFLPMLTPRATGDMQYDLPDIGDQVLVLFLPYALEQGFVLGAMYGGNNPPTTNPDVWHRTFSDGTVLEYDRGAHKLKADVKGELEAQATGVAKLKSEQQVILDAPLILALGTFVNMGRDGGAGNAVITGDVSVLKGAVEVAGDVVGAGVSLASHLHTGVQSGSASTGAPVAGTGSSESPSPGDPDDDCASNPRPSCIIPCLPAIAESMAETDGMSQEDVTGWEYLAAMFQKWLDLVDLEASGESQGATTFFVSWEWAMSFLRLKTRYGSFVLPILDIPDGEYDPPKKNIYNEASQKSLGYILNREGYLSGDGPISFDFINTTWEERKKCSYTEISLALPIPSVSGDGILLDGLFTALGAFTVRAVASGHAKKNPDGTWKITVTRVEVYIDDIFNFEGDDEGPFGLGFWSCARKKGAAIERRDGSYVFLRNKNFREYAKDVTKKEICPEFPVRSLLHLVETFKEFSYDYK